jgi:hypothetical protein
VTREADVWDMLHLTVVVEGYQRFGLITGFRQGALGGLVFDRRRLTARCLRRHIELHHLDGGVLGLESRRLGDILPEELAIVGSGG